MQLGAHVGAQLGAHLHAQQGVFRGVWWCIPGVKGENRMRVKGYAWRWKRNMIRWLLAQLDIEQKYIAAIIEEFDKHETSNQIITNHLKRVEQYRIKEIEQCRPSLIGAGPSRGSLREGYIYFILDRSKNAVKIGFSIDPTSRLAAIQSSNPAPLVLVATIEGNMRREKLYHDLFAAYRLNGEWFTLSTELRSFIVELRNNSESGDLR